ncbi:DUF2157 domain-containing protein [Kiloniella litopenaei]|uniref:DUF2157 domain-containing protein n=1 Tax=Kiloniella litopenaei TaxID=1549748 RepID=UPI000695E70C|nr:DUF2157 domain-containing protein [Kiloniella litopenaei]
MNTTEQIEPPPQSLDQIPVTRALIDQLYSYGKINRQARNAALQHLIPHTQWGIWASRLLLGLGVCLVLSGVIYFFAFNWAKLLPAHKLGGIQFAIIASIIAACVCGLPRLSGQLALISASVFVGAFLAVFGQIYQTGADAYQLFMVWSLLIFGWTILSRFAAHWVLWLVIFNVFLGLWWEQVPISRSWIGPDWSPLILPLLACFNGLVLCTREILSNKTSFRWLAAKWTRWIILIPILVLLNIPILLLIADPDQAYEGVFIGSFVGAIGHICVYVYYRKIVRDIWSLAAITISALIIVETLAIRVLFEILMDEEELGLLLMGIVTIGIITGFTMYLRHLTRVLNEEDKKQSTEKPAISEKEDMGASDA